ncbi:MAG: restriction endonuclease, partial [Desulfurococcaceae archaeon]
MNSSGKAPRLLREHEPCYLTKEQVPEELSGCLHERVGPYIEVDYPSPKTGGLWKVTPSGWVGYLPLGKDFSFSIQPKVSLEILFGMLEVAFDLKSFRLFEGLAYCKTLEEFYERLATILCRRVLDRARMGLYRSYVQEDDRLPFLRGRLDLPSTLRRPWSTSLDCSFQEHTADLDENRILGWTLTRILAAGPCGEKLRALARKAFHSLQGHASLVPYSPASCSRRQYNRLNLDYQPMHALCRFFL